MARVVEFWEIADFIILFQKESALICQFKFFYDACSVYGFIYLFYLAFYSTAFVIFHYCCI